MLVTPGVYTSADARLGLSPLSTPPATSTRVCELVLGRAPLREKRESLARMRGEVPSRSSNLRGAAAMNEGDGQIAQCCHHLKNPLPLSALYLVHFPCGSCSLITLSSSALGGTVSAQSGASLKGQP